MQVAIKADGVRSPEASYMALQCLAKTTLVICFSVVGTLIFLWLFNSNPGNSLFRSCLIPYLSLLGIISFFIQSLLGYWLRNRQGEGSVWYFLGKYEAFKRLSYHLEWTRIPVSLEYLSDKKIGESKDISIVVEDFFVESAESLKYLLTLQQRGCTVLSREDWCEAVLQRFPSEYLSNADLLRGAFSVPRKTFQLRLKRVGDLFFSILLLLVTSPILIISSLMIKLEDGGPIFYSQIRTGLEVPRTLFTNYEACVLMRRERVRSGLSVQTPVLRVSVLSCGLVVWMSYPNFGVL